MIAVKGIRTRISVPMTRRGQLLLSLCRHKMQLSTTDQNIGAAHVMRYGLELLAKELLDPKEFESLPQDDL